MNKDGVVVGWSRWFFMVWLLLLLWSSQVVTSFSFSSVPSSSLSSSSLSDFDPFPLLQDNHGDKDDKDETVQKRRKPSDSTTNSNHDEDKSAGSSSTTTTTVIQVPPFLSQQREGYPSALHSIYIQDILTPEEAQKCNDISQGYASQTGRWKTPDGIRHTSYPTCDFPVEDCRILDSYLESIQFTQRMFGNLSQWYGIDIHDLEYLDFFVAHYQAKKNQGDDDDNDEDDDDSAIMDRLELHRDGSLLSFSLLLNDPTDFTGGGTWYDALRDVVVPSTTTTATTATTSYDGVLHSGGIIRPTKAGMACLHCGKLLHGADVVTSGHRTVLVGFIQVSERNIRPGVLTTACTNWGRMDVATFRYKRQDEKNHKGWILNHGPFLGGRRGSNHPPSHIKGMAPAFSSVIRRADPEYQRTKKLEAEDELLRNILLNPKERPEYPFGDDGSITIL